MPPHDQLMGDSPNRRVTTFVIVAEDVSVLTGFKATGAAANTVMTSSHDVIDHALPCLPRWVYQEWLVVSSGRCYSHNNLMRRRLCLIVRIQASRALVPGAGP